MTAQALKHRLASTLLFSLSLFAADSPLAQHRNLGKAFYENPTTPNEAVAELKKARDLAPTSSRDQLNYALALLRAAKTTQAVTILRSVQQRDPALPHTSFNLGIYYKKSGDTTEAIVQFERFVRLVPSESIGHYQLGTLYKLAGRAADALSQFETAARLNPLLAAAQFQLYGMYRAAGRQTESAQALETFLKLKKDAEGSATPEDVDWSSYAELYDPPATPAGGAVSSGPASPTNVPGDYDNDGLMDACVLTGAGAALFHNTNGKLTPSEIKLPAGPFSQAIWIDYDHDYDLDLILLGPKSYLLRNEGGSGFSDHTADFPFDSALPTAALKLRVTPDSKAFDLAVWYGDRAVLYRDQLGGHYTATPYDGKPPLAEPVEHPTGHWIKVELQGVKNLKLAQDALVEIKTGALYRRQFYAGVPLTFDVGGNTVVDVVRITWPNGLIQNEIKQSTNRAHAYREAQRLSGSCPMIWTWNGKGIEFITDVLGVAPLGASDGEGTYFPVDHDEYVTIPGRALAPVDGQYDIRVTEELSEVSYLDQIQLLAIDHPPGVEIFTNEKFKGPPYPEYKLYGVNRRVYPTAAHDDLGRDVLPRLLVRDRQYPDRFPRSELGVAKPHTLDLDFTGAAPGGDAVLLLNGWVDWPDGSTFRAAAQEIKGGLVMPYLQMQDARGVWQTVNQDMGMPAGKPKTIAVDLHYLSASRKLRIVTNLCVYWDEIFLSEDVSGPEVQQNQARLLSADLHFRGFSDTQIHPERKQPDQFYYDHVSADTFWNPTSGMYTRYGEVGELLKDVDDRLVLMGSGDEMRLRFSADSLPPLPSGWTRDFLLKVDGWAKDRDPNTAFGDTVEPLPFHGMSQYPYPGSEHFPDDEPHRQYRKEFNTRPALRLIPRLNGTR